MGASTRARFAQITVIATAAALCLPMGVASPSQAATPAQPAGGPLILGTPGAKDRFINRRPVGQEALVLAGIEGFQEEFGDLLNPEVDLLRLNVAGNPPELQSTTRAMRVVEKSATSAFQSAAVEADLDVLPGSRPSREPGLAQAGIGLKCATPTTFCVTWSRPSYSAGTHTFAEFAQTYAVSLPASEYPEDGSKVGLVVGRFAPGGLPTLMLSYVDRDTDSLKVAHIGVQRADGRVSGLGIQGPVLNLGKVLFDGGNALSASMAAGDVTEAGSDQVGIVWAPESSSQADRMYRVALLSLDARGELTSNVAPQDVHLPLRAMDDSGIRQTTPGITALLDNRDRAHPTYHLVVGAGVYGFPQLQSLAINANGEFDVTSAGVRDTSGLPVPNRGWAVFHSHLESLGDVSGDGLDDFASLADADLQIDDDHGYLEILTTDDFNDPSFTVRDRPQVDPGSRMVALDARTTSSQIVAPVPGQVMQTALPQIAVVSIDRSNWMCALGGRGYLAISMFALRDTGRVVPSQLQPAGCLIDPVVPTVASLALDGRAEIGDPVSGQYTSLEPSVILNAPPTHFDVLDGKMYDPNFCYAGNQYLVPPVCFFTSEYERKTNTSLEVSSESNEDWAVSAKLSTSFNILSLVDIEAEFRGGYGEHFKKVDGVTTTDTVEVNVKARNTDKIYAIRRAYDTLEYPVFQPGEADPSGYILTTTPFTVSKRWIDINSPDALNIDVNHEPGNILSYPENISTDENPFISPTQKDATSPVVEAFAPQEFELSDFSDFTYTLTQEKVTTSEASTEKKWNVGSTIKGGGKVAGLVDVSLEVSGDYSQSNLSTTKTTVGDSTKLSAVLGGIDESFGETAYTVKPFAYWTDSAALVLDYAVSPGVAAPGAPKTWWQLKYGKNPDLTMKLPRLLDYEKQAGISSDSARFISSGMRIFRGPCTPGDPRVPTTTYAVPGAPLCARVEVENYSLKAAPEGTTVKFYDADPDVGGVLLGTSQSLPAIPARESAFAYFSWTPDARYAGSVPRLFAVVDSDNAVTEIHEDNNKGFRAYRAVPDVTSALRAPDDVEVDLSSGRTMDIRWTDPLQDVQPDGHQWRVVAYRDDGLAPIEQVVDGSELSATMADVAPGRYRIAVFAVDGSQSSPASHPSEPVDVASEIPGTPANVRGTPGDGAVAVQWTAPVVTGGVPVDSYRIREHRQSGEDYPQAAIDTIVNGNTTGLTLSGLTNGRPYRFTVQALNAAGPGDQSLPSAAVTPLGVPEAATNVKAERGGQQIAHLSWDPPALSSARSEVTSYQITVMPGGSIVEVPGRNATSDVPDLQPGVRYTFTVRPLSATGRGPNSVESNPLTLPGAPSAARSVTAKAGAEPGTAVVSWIQPATTGGVALDSYRVCQVGGQCQQEPATAGRTTFGGLPVGTPLLFTVTARNEAGIDSPTETSQELVLAVAPQVRITQSPAEGSHTRPSAMIEFTSSIPGAQITCFVDGVGSPCSSPLLLNGLANGRHTFRAMATSEGGSAATPLLTWTVDGIAPKASVDDLPLVARKGIPRVKYSAVDHGGAGLAGYELRTRTNSLVGDFSAPVIVADPSPDGQRVRRLNVERGTTVCASVRASDRVGNTSEWSQWKCAARPLDESAMEPFGYWTPVKSQFFAKGSALRTVSPGSALSVRIGRSEKVTVTAVSCGNCGRLEVRHRGEVVKVLNLGDDRLGPDSGKAGRHAKEFRVPWPESARGELRLVTLGGGPVTVDAVTVVRQR